MNRYQKQKEKIRNAAINYQNSFANDTIYFYSDLFSITEYFYKMGKRYGLLTEFRENGIL